MIQNQTEGLKEVKIELHMRLKASLFLFKVS